MNTGCEARRRRGWARRRSSHRRIRRGAAPRRRARPSRCCRRRSRDEREPQGPSESQAPKSSVSGGRDQPPMGGHRGDGQALPGLDPVRLVSLVGWVCSSSAQKEGKKAAATLSVSFIDTPFSARPESWLVVARSASAPLRLVGHLGWVHRQEARAVGRPRERMMPLREALTPRRDRAGLARKTRGAKGGGQVWYPRVGRSECLPHRSCRSASPRFEASLRLPPFLLLGLTLCVKESA